MNVFFLENQNYSLKLMQEIESSFKVQKKLNNETNIIFCRLGFYLGEKLLKESKSLKYIVSPTTNLNHIDLDYCKLKNITVISLKDISKKIEKIYSTSELNLFFIIGLIRNIFLAESIWEKTGPIDRMRFRGRELSKMKVGIVGLGRIGNHLKNYLDSFKVEVFFYDIRMINQNKSKYCCSSLEELIHKSDIISINADLNKSSYKMFSEKEFLLLRNKYLVNTARAEIIEKKYLIEALSENILLGYATDVYWDEQKNNNKYDTDLMNLKKKGKNIILTPHLGGCTIDAMQETEELMFNLLKNFINNEVKS